MLCRNTSEDEAGLQGPFECNSEGVKKLRYNYVQVSPIIDAYSQHCIYYTYFSIVIIMIVLHNSDHSMSISDIVMCVSDSP